MFTDTEVNWGFECMYHPVLKRYLLTVTHGTGANAGEGPGLGIFDAPEPWGPWTTVYYSDQWKDSHAKFCFEFPAKWISADGLTMWMKYSGWPEYDNYNHLKCTLAAGGDTTAPAPPENLSVSPIPP